MDKFVIIDGNSLINRAFYALPLLANFDGEFSNAVFGFTNILVKAINEIQPKYMCVAFDFGKKTFRNEMYSEYKGTRKPTPMELVSQFPILKNLLTAMNIKIIEIEGVEADDIIGTLTKKFNVENIVITGDKDAFQLINDNTKVMFTKKGVSEVALLDIDGLNETYGLAPYQVIELKALMGDSSDNIPGVPGVGEKTATALLEKYLTVDGVYNDLENIPGKLYDKLKDGKEIAYLSKSLATIKLDVEIDCKLEEFEFTYPFTKNVHEIFVKYQFNTLLKRKDLFVSEIAENIYVPEVGKVEKINITDISAVKKLANEALKQKEVAFVFDGILGISFLQFEYEINFNQDLLSSGLDMAEVFDVLKPVFESEKILKILFDYKTILHKLRQFDISLNGKIFDVLIARYLINNTAKSNIKIDELLVEQVQNAKHLAHGIYMIYKIFSKRLTELNLENLFWEIEMPLAKVLFEMEIAGFKINVPELSELDLKYKNLIEELTLKIYESAGVEFNINSPKQMADVLFTQLGIKAFNNKKNSTSVEVLESIVNKHEVVRLVLDYRRHSKLYNTYIKAFLELVDKNTNKIHTVFNQTNTATGRLSSNEPNLQNIPVRTQEGRNFRKVFVSSFEDGYIVSADYSQIELRLLASFSKDEKLIETFNNGVDIHTKTASEIFGVSVSDVTSEMRRDAKAVNFGVIYGISDYGLSQNINSSVETASNYIKTYFEKYPVVKQYLEQSVNECKENGFVKTLFGRIRFIPEINSSNYNLRQFAERAAMNMPLQGSASDIIKVAMIKVSNEFEKQKLQSKLILQVHDELLVDTKKDELEKVKSILKNCMESVVELPVKLDVNIGYGKDWFEA